MCEDREIPAGEALISIRSFSIVEAAHRRLFAAGRLPAYEVDDLISGEVFKVREEGYMRIAISQKVNIINRRFCAAIIVVILALPFAVQAEDAELPPASNGSTGDRPGEPPQSSPEIDAIRATAHDFTEAFNRGDARAMAAYWTPEGEFIGPDGSTLVGRESIVSQKSGTRLRSESRITATGNPAQVTDQTPKATRLRPRLTKSIRRTGPTP
jgi:hypothetical protein